MRVIMHIYSMEEKNMASESGFGIMEQKRAEMQAEFLKLTPMERMNKMSALFNDMIAAKARALGVSEYEVYSRYLEIRDQYYRRNQENL